MVGTASATRASPIRTSSTSGLLALLGPQPAAAVPGRQQRHGVGADVVPGAGELRAGVAQTDDQQVGRGPPARRCLPARSPAPRRRRRA